MEPGPDEDGASAGGVEAGWRRRLRTWTEDTALNLAALRVTVGVVVLQLPDLRHAPAYASLPPAVRSAPVGLGPWLRTLGPEVVAPLTAVVVLALLLGTVGLFTRTAWTVAAIGLLVVLGVPHTVGAVFHDHHLVWLAALLAASPSGDALSVDAWRAARRGRRLERGRSVAYGLPLRFAWVLLGMVFFFPGLWKVLTGGAAWVLGDNLRFQMYAKWAQNEGFRPPFRVDRFPALLHLGALYVVLLELSFGALVLFRRTRLWAVGGALAFHALTALFLNLRFSALWLCYVAFVDVSDLLGRDEPPQEDRGPAEVRPILTVGTVLVAGAFAFGAAGISEGWPFACYPKFDRVLTDPSLPALEVEVVDPEGARRTLGVRELNPDGATPRWWALSWSLIGAYDGVPATPERFRAWWGRVGPPLPPGSTVRFSRVRVSTVPEEADAPPRDRRVLTEIALPEPSEARPGTP